MGDVEAEALGLWAILDCARDKVDEMEKECQDAKAAYEEASTQRDAIDVMVKEQETVLEELSEKKEVQLGKAQAHAGVIEALNRLQRYEYGADKVDDVTVEDSPVAIKKCLESAQVLLEGHIEPPVV